MRKDIGKHSSEEKTHKTNKHLTIFNITGDQRTHIMTQRDTISHLFNCYKLVWQLLVFKMTSIKRQRCWHLTFNLNHFLFDMTRMYLFPPFLLLSGTNALFSYIHKPSLPHRKGGELICSPWPPLMKPPLWTHHLNILWGRVTSSWWKVLHSQLSQRAI